MKTQQITFRVRIVVERDGDGFHAFAPDIKGVHAMGDTEQEAREHVKEGVVLTFISLLQHGEPLPVGLAVCAGRRSVFSILREAFRDRFPPASRHSYLEDVAVPAFC